MNMLPAVLLVGFRDLPDVARERGEYHAGERGYAHHLDSEVEHCSDGLLAQKLEIWHHAEREERDGEERHRPKLQMRHDHLHRDEQDHRIDGSPCLKAGDS